MSNSFFMPFYRFLCIFIASVLLICCLFIPIISSSAISLEELDCSGLLSSSGYLWPTPGYTYITSYFGSRDAPTSTASSFHSGIDIGAPEGASFIAITSGKITFTGFLGGGGYTITLTSGNVKITYCHVSPIYIVKTGDYVQQGQIIGYVGPKNVYGVPGNFYFDEYR